MRLKLMMVLIFFLFARMSCRKIPTNDCIQFKNASDKWVYVYYNGHYTDTVLTEREQKILNDKAVGKSTAGISITSVAPGGCEMIEREGYGVTETWQAMVPKDTLLVYVLDSAVLVSTHDADAAKLRLMQVTYGQLKNSNDTLTYSN